MKRTLIDRFRRSESGGGTITGICTITITALLVGIAMDQANAWRVDTQLQIATDAAALAAAAHATDPETGRDIAMQVVAMNMGSALSGAITDADIVFGAYDAETDSFDPAAEEPNAARVIAIRNAERGNAVDTMLLRLSGIDEWNIAASSIALMASSGGQMDANACADAMFLSTGEINTGGGNSLYGSVCMHGESGIRTGGGSQYNEDVRFSSPDKANIRINTYRPNDLELEEIIVEQSMTPTILPTLERMSADLRSAIWNSGASTYSGDLLPPFVRDPATGSARIVRVSNWWTIQPGDIEPYTIYYINGGAQFAGNIDAQNVAFIVEGQIGVGGGKDLHFDNVFFLADTVQLAGNITWGPKIAPCEATDYSVYLFGRNRLSMGGWGKKTEIHNVVGAAPQFSPGGGMTGSNLYFEMQGHTSIGGNIDIYGCGERPESYYDLATPDDQNAGGAAVLVQ